MMATPKRSIALCGVALAALPLLAMAQDYPGLVQPRHDITLATGVGGIVASKRVKAGAKVGAHQVLMVLDDRLQAVEADRRKVIMEDNSELKATEERARISKSLFDDAQRVYDRTGAISRDELMRLEAEYAAAAGRLDQLKAQKERERIEHGGAVQERAMRQVVAPVAGVVTKADIEVGEWAKPGEALIRLVDASTLVFKANLPMSAAVKLKTADVVPVLVEDGAKVVAVPARLSFVSPVADAASGLVEVRAEIANPGMRLRPGSKAVMRLGDPQGAANAQGAAAVARQP